MKKRDIAKAGAELMCTFGGGVLGGVMFGGSMVLCPVNKFLKASTFVTCVGLGDHLGALASARIVTAIDNACELYDLAVAGFKNGYNGGDTNGTSGYEYQAEQDV